MVIYLTQDSFKVGQYALGKDTHEGLELGCFEVELMAIMADLVGRRWVLAALYSWSTCGNSLIFFIQEI